MINELLQTSLQESGLLHSLLVLVLVYLGGVFTSFTPCIFPMIPITFSILGRQDSVELDHKTIVKRVLVYGFGVSIAFLGLGILAVLTRSMFGALTQHIGFKIAVAGIFTLLGLNTLGVISIPQFQFSAKDSRSYLGIFGLGVAAGLSLSPCTLPILAIVLRFAAQSSLFFGALMMWLYAWGFMSLILILTVFGKEALNRLFQKKKYLHIMDKVLAGMCFAVAAWILSSIF